MGEVVPLERFQRAQALRQDRDPQEARLTTAELCKVLRVSPSTVKRWRNAGMPYEPWSKRLYRYRLSHVLRWREQHSAA